MTIAERIRALREDNDMTQKEVANVLQIAQTVYSRYEREANKLPIHHLEKICLLYHVSADYILGLPKGLDYPKR